MVNVSAALLVLLECYRHRSTESSDGKGDLLHFRLLPSGYYFQARSWSLFWSSCCFYCSMLCVSHACQPSGCLLRRGRFYFLAWTMIVVHVVRREAKRLLTCLYQSVDVNLNRKKWTCFSLLFFAWGWYFFGGRGWVVVQGFWTNTSCLHRLTLHHLGPLGRGLWHSLCCFCIIDLCI